MRSCPRCGELAQKVIYFGFPMRLCLADDCHTLFGVWSWIAPALPMSDGEDFAFLAYEGSYWPALVAWLRDDV